MRTFNHLFLFYYSGRWASPTCPARSKLHRKGGLFARLFVLKFYREPSTFDKGGNSLIKQIHLKQNRYFFPNNKLDYYYYSGKNTCFNHHPTTTRKHPQFVLCVEKVLSYLNRNIVPHNCLKVIFQYFFGFPNRADRDM